MSNTCNIACPAPGMMDFPDTSHREQRNGPDRRRRPTPPISRYWLFGRRRASRREEESANVYVDRYTATEWVLVLGVLVLSVLDMYFTLVHLDHGGTEANPVMAATLTAGGTGLFKLVKLAATFIGLGVLLVHIRFRRVKTLLSFAFLLYAGVFVFHMYLMFLRANPGL